MAPRFSTIGSMEGGVYTLNTPTSSAEPEQINYQGATMVFVLQGTAPTGWVKDTSRNDYTLRCVTGSVSSGGSSVFTSVMSSKTLSGSLSVTGTVGATSLTASQIPAHHHGPYAATAVVRLSTASLAPGPSSARKAISNFNPSQASPNGTTVGDGDPHDHPLWPVPTTSPVTFSTVDLSVKYVEAILATRS